MIEGVHLSKRLGYICLLLGLLSIAYLPTASMASGLRGPVNLRLTVSPQLVDVGGAVSFTLGGRYWPPRSRAVLSFVSPHHGFSGPMAWDGRCSCFRVAVALARRIHPLETAKARATVTYGKSTAQVSTNFMIRGLAANGRDFAPGGTAHLSVWVSDPAPFAGEYEHYCAWVKTSDGLGVSGFRVSFSVHFKGKTSNWFAGVTGPDGVLCAHRSIGSPPEGVPVTVQVYANSLRGTTSFTPRS